MCHRRKAEAVALRIYHRDGGQTKDLNGGCNDVKNTQAQGNGLEARHLICGRNERMLSTSNTLLGGCEVEDPPISDCVTSLKELTYTPERKPLAKNVSRNMSPGEKHTALVEPSMASARGRHRNRSSGNTYHRKDQSPVINATAKSNSIIQSHRSAAARTEEDDGSEI